MWPQIGHFRFCTDFSSITQRSKAGFWTQKNFMFEELVETDNSISVYNQNIQVLASELYKIMNGLSPETMKEFFAFSENTTYNAMN